MKPTSKAEQILKELKFDFSAFSLEAFIRHVGQYKGREIISIAWEMEMPCGVFGAWMLDADNPVAYIFYRSDLVPMHKIHVQLHELAHFLYGHPTLELSRDLLTRIAAGTAPLPLSDLPHLRSTTHTEIIDVEAETLADLIQERVIRLASIDRLVHSAVPEEKLADFLKTLSAA
ncbi:MAG: hypothetical protein WA821_19675 [Anaerolineales bacterium]